MGTIKADTLTGLADPNKITLPSGDVTNTTFAMGETLTVGSTTATLNFGNTVIANASAGSSTITGEGGSTTTNIQQGLVKAWVKFNGEASSITPDDSFNVSGLTDNGTGDYAVAINNDMANDDYAITCNGSEQVFSIYNISNTLVGSVRVYSQHQDSATNAQEASVQITGDLA